MCLWWTGTVLYVLEIVSWASWWILCPSLKWMKARIPIPRSIITMCLPGLRLCVTGILLNGLITSRTDFRIYFRGHDHSDRFPCAAGAGHEVFAGRIFLRNLDRHLRLNYPTLIFDEYRFEVDDEGNPYWICPLLITPSVCLAVWIFAALSLWMPVPEQASIWILPMCLHGWIRPILRYCCSADRLLGQIPQWLFKYHFGQKDVCVTSGGYNYLALEDDVWLYTGLTSSGNDASNIGFVLVNMRTKEARNYTVSGATEYSAMSSQKARFSICPMWRPSRFC